MIVQDKEHRTDDCHGKISHELLNQLRQSEDFAIPANTLFQFRAGITNAWVAKGTLQVELNLPQGVDLVMPLSAKGRLLLGVLIGNISIFEPISS